MKCPFCQHPDDRVVDSREASDGDSVRRRRECLSCAKRFTTYERVDAFMPMLVKKDGSRVHWDREKVRSGMQKACEKRPVPVAEIDRAVDEIERTIQDQGSGEIATSVVGERVMDRLKALDEVAYVRFASVYKSFRDIDEFMGELESLVRERRSSR